MSGGTPPSKDPSNFTQTGGIPWITPADLSGYKQVYIRHGARNLSEKGFAECSAAKIKAGSVLFSSRAPIGYVAIAANELTTNQGFKSFVLPDGIDSRYVYYYLRHIKPLAEERATGTTFKELSGSATAQLPFIVAASNEQTRIADKLDILLEQVDTCRQKLNCASAYLKQFRQAVLAAATSGQLTEDWRQHNSETEPAIEYLARILTAQKIGYAPPSISDNDIVSDLPTSWERVSYATLMSSIRSGSTAVPIDEPTDYPILRSSSIRSGSVNLDDIRYLRAEDSSNDRNYLSDGDLIFTRLSGSVDYVANCAVIKGLGARRIQYPDRIFCTKPLSQEIADFANLCFMAPYTRRVIEEKAKSSAGHQRISIPDITHHTLPFPPYAEQHEIVKRVKTLFTFADQLEMRAQTAHAEVQRLTPTILAKAFRGELVPQDPNDEPASALLERVRTARTEAETIPQPAVMLRRPIMPKMDRQTAMQTIELLPSSKINFDDVYRKMPGDYDTLKEIVFNLLNEAPTLFSSTNGHLNQIFDHEEGTVRLVRGTQ